MSTTESWPRRLVDTAGSPEPRSARERRTEELLRAAGPELDPQTREAVYRAAAHTALSDDRMPLWPPPRRRCGRAPRVRRHGMVDPRAGRRRTDGARGGDLRDG
ncbi:MAG: hypothetical protein M5U28_39365 [Sandaracinaceae bacterium]|nr:hypothetical protein [Sandaracinaceae bacterium]